MGISENAVVTAQQAQWQNAKQDGRESFKNISSGATTKLWT